MHLKKVFSKEKKKLYTIVIEILRVMYWNLTHNKNKIQSLNNTSEK